jgi:flagellar protein FliS
VNYTAVRSRYLQDTVATASPSTLLTMLYDRLVLDLQRAETAQRAGDRAAAGRELVHAQDIVHELAATLDTSGWDGGPRLLSVYTFLLSELAGANVSQDVERTAACRELVEPLRDAWHEAAAQLAGATLEPPAAVPVGAPRGELGIG